MFRAGWLAGFVFIVSSVVTTWAAPPAPDPGFDAWGGWRGVSGTATGRFRTERQNGVWWLITPDGHGFFSVGVDHLRPGGDFSPALGTAPYYDNIIARYGSEAGWAAATLPRLQGLGVNTIGAFSEPEWFPNAIAYTVRLGLSSYAPAVPGVPTPIVARETRDYFAPAFASGVAANINAQAGPCAADPWCIGIFPDNELALGQSLAQVWPYLDAYLTLPANAPGKLAAQAFLAARYADDVAAFNAVWGTSLTSFDDLQAITALSPAPASPPARPTGSAAQIADRRAFDAHVAARFHAVVFTALRGVSPDMLILGSRLLIVSTRPEVLTAIAPYLDVLTVNYYELDINLLNVLPNYPGDYGMPLTRLFEDLDAMHRLVDKPLMIGEFSYRAADAGLPNTLPPFFPTYPTQADRAQAAGAYLRRVIARPYLVGAHWFQYMDQPATGRVDGENQNFGLVDIHDDLWTVLTDRFRAVATTAVGRRSLATGIGGGAADDCLLEWTTTAPLVPTTRSAPPARFTCRDGDPSCDVDTVPGQCTIEVQPCAGVSDARVACAPAALDAVQVRRPNPARAPALFAALQASFATMTGPTHGAACGSSVTVTLPLGGRRKAHETLRLRATAGARSDADTVRLLCTAS